MAGNTVTLKFVGDSSSLERTFRTVDQGVDNTESKLTKLSSGLKDFGSKMAGMGSKLSLGVTAPLALIGKKAFDAASDLAESHSKASVVFGDWIIDIEQFAEKAAENFGLSKQEALEATGTFGNLFSAMGLGHGESMDLSTGLVKLAADLGSFSNLGTDEVLEKLRSGLVGEIEPLRALGVSFNAADVEAQALKMGLADAHGEFSEGAKVQARYALIMEKTKLAQGDFARTADGAANKQKIAAAKIKDSMAELGTALIPIGQKLIGFVSDLAEKFGALGPSAQQFVLIGVAIAAAIGPVMTVIGGLVAALGLLISPVGLVVVAVAALVAGVVLAYREFEGFRDLVDNVARSIKEKWEQVSEFIRQISPQIEEAVGHIVAVVKELWSRFGDEISEFTRIVWDRIKGTIEAALKIVQGVIQTVTALINGDWGKFWDGIKDTVGGVWDLIKTQVESAIRTVGLVIELGLSAVRGIWDAAWSAMKDVVSGVFGFLEAAVRGGFAKIVDITLGFSENFLKLADKAFGWVPVIGPKIGEAAKAVEEFRDRALAAINGVPDTKNITVNVDAANAIASFERIKHLADNLPRSSEAPIHVEGSPPHAVLAQGGIVTSPTMALIGEAGAEVVLPLRKPDRMAQLLQQAGVLRDFPNAPTGLGVGGIGGAGGMAVMVQIEVHGSVISEGQIIENIRRALIKDSKRGRVAQVA